MYMYIYIYTCNHMYILYMYESRDMLDPRFIHRVHILPSSRWWWRFWQRSMAWNVLSFQEFLASSGENSGNRCCKAMGTDVKNTKVKAHDWWCFRPKCGVDLNPPWFSGFYIHESASLVVNIRGWQTWPLGDVGIWGNTRCHELSGWNRFLPHQTSHKRYIAEFILEDFCPSKTPFS